MYVALDALFSVRNEPKGLNNKGWKPGIPLVLPGIIDSSLHACLYALELTFVCYCHREVLSAGD